MTVKVYSPQCQVALIKSLPRSELVPGLKANSTRYNRGTGIDLMPFLGDGSNIHVTKSTRSAMGNFSIRFSDQMDATLFETLSALAEPGDLIEIRMSREAVPLGKQIPLIMRGFVSDITRSENVDQNGKPQRFSEIRGADLQKILSTYIINYKVGRRTNAYSMVEWRFFSAFTGSTPTKALSGNEFVKIIVDIVNKQIESMRSLAQLEGEKTTASDSILNWQLSAIVDGTVSSTAINSATDVSLYDLCKLLLDVGSGFNELFLEDRDGYPPTLILRPTPFKTVKGEWVQPDSWADEMAISSNDIVSMTTTRSDEGIANYFYITSPSLAFLGIDQQDIMLSGNVDSFSRLTAHNSHEAIHGWRELSVETAMYDNQASHDQNSFKEKEIEEERGIAKDWVTKRRETLISINESNILFENCQLTVKGDPFLKPGTFIRLYRGINQTFVGEGYCYEVSHTWVPFQGFTTNCKLDRYTGFIERSKAPISLYIGEIEQGIISEKKGN
jgi:hypothetical protein